jgi:hypothetical protein
MIAGFADKPRFYQITIGFADERLDFLSTSRDG